MNLDKIELSILIKKYSSMYIYDSAHRGIAHDCVHSQIQCVGWMVQISPTN